MTAREFLEDDHDALDVAEANPDQAFDCALVVGVNDYVALHPLRGAVEDARAFAEWLVDPAGGGIAEENVRTIFSTRHPLSPVGDAIDEALETLIARAARGGGRRFYFYFSGHACTGDRPHDLALCLADWSGLRRRASLGSDAWLDVILASGMFAEVAFFLDCCRVTALRAVGRPPKIDFAEPGERKRAPRAFLAYATEFLRTAREVEEPAAAGVTSEVRGIFTKVLVAGLRGAAAGNDGIVTAASLKQYIERMTLRRSEERGFVQRAEVMDGFESTARFGSSIRPAKLRISFAPSLTKDHREEVVLYGPRREEIRRGRPADGAWELDLAPGLYKLVWIATGRSAFIDYAREDDVVAYHFDPLASRSHVYAELSSRPDSVNSPTNANARWLKSETIDALGSVIDYRPTGIVICFSGQNADNLRGAWFLRGADRTIEIGGDATPMEEDVEGCVFSTRLEPGSYVLCHARAPVREFAIGVSRAWTTTVLIVYEAGTPRLDAIRVSLVGLDNPFAMTVEQTSAEHFFSLEAGFDSPRANLAFSEKAQVWRGHRDPIIELLGAHRHAGAGLSAAELDAIATGLEKKMGPSPDVDALRLRAAIVHHSPIPQKRFLYPPMLRAGLAALVEASHQVPELIPPGSALEYMCVERLVDSPLSSWPARSERTVDGEDWLTTTVREFVTEHADEMATLDARTVAHELGVPTMAVQTRLMNERTRATSSAATSPAKTQRRREAKPPSSALPEVTPTVSFAAPTIAGYRIERLIGQGGMGRVYLAVREATGERVAIKTMQSHTGASRSAHRRFLREIEALAALRHDRIIALLDHGQADRSFYFVMAYHKRGNLTDWVRRLGRPQLREALRITLDVLDGLSYAHRLGYVHRDIKPENILMDASHTPLITDFGLAKCFEKAGFSDITRSGVTAGTAAYIPREQVLDFKHVRPTSDVWATAAVLYWLLTGATPRRQGSGGDDAFIAILRDPVVPIRERTSDLPGPLCDLLDRALSDDPAMRPKDAGAFQTLLRRVMESD